MRIYFTVITAVLVVISAASVQAQPSWVWGPDFAAQRDIQWSFTSQDWKSPTDYTGQEWGNGDFVTIDGAVQWFDSSPIWPGHSGLIGIDNTNGTETLQGTVMFNISNNSINAAATNVWCEFVYYDVFADGGGKSLTSQLIAFGGGSASGYLLGMQQLPDAIYPATAYIERYSGQASAGASSQAYLWSFAVPAGQATFIDDFHIATTGVPEPSCLIIVSMGLAAAICRRNWNRK